MKLARLIALALAASVALAASADIPTPTPTSTGLMGSLSSQIGDAKKQAANAPRDAMSSVYGADAGPPGSTSSSGASSSSGGPADSGSEHDLPSEADLDASLPERRAEAQERLAAHLSSEIGDKPVDASLLDELRRHARAIARLDRIGFVASAQHDDAAMKRVTALLSDEFQRHASEVDRWLAR
ncbi:MAG: hypothetical protein U0414_23605 [Polyangiaceae bacterium]